VVLEFDALRQMIVIHYSAKDTEGMRRLLEEIQKDLKHRMRGIKLVDSEFVKSIASLLLARKAAP
jgi:hypothetical protein